VRRAVSDLTLDKLFLRGLYYIEQPLGDNAAFAIAQRRHLLHLARELVIGSLRARTAEHCLAQRPMGMASTSLQRYVRHGTP
jgi:hypothetical protein